MPSCFLSQPYSINVKVVLTAFSIKSFLFSLTPTSIINHIDSRPCPGLTSLPSNVSDKDPSIFKFSTIIPPSSGRRNTSITSSMQWSMVCSIVSSSSRCSISRVRLHKIMGKKILSVVVFQDMLYSTSLLGFLSLKVFFQKCFLLCQHIFHSELQGLAGQMPLLRKYMKKYCMVLPMAFHLV